MRDGEVTPRGLVGGEVALAGFLGGSIGDIGESRVDVSGPGSCESARCVG